MLKKIIPALGSLNGWHCFCYIFLMLCLDAMRGMLMGKAGYFRVVGWVNRIHWLGCTNQKWILIIWRKSNAQPWIYENRVLS